MKVTRTEIHDVVIIEPDVFNDERGFFFESYNQLKFEQAIGRKVNFVQDNHSLSIEQVLRGLHYQIPPNAQAKLIRVIRGKIFDVVVDIRKDSQTFGHWAGEILSAKNKKQLWIPEGFAHGFLTLSKSAEIIYKTTDYYCPQSERAIAWDDFRIGIVWHGLKEPVLSTKDIMAKKLDELLDKDDLF
tara:strand:- start:649 stop:1206 length:558 start_codon:yes stop_codon:yes gene_type:complete